LRTIFFPQLFSLRQEKVSFWTMYVLHPDLHSKASMLWMTAAAA